MFILSLLSGWLLRPEVNAMFDRHPIHFEGSPKGLIKPKASIKYYYTEHRDEPDYQSTSNNRNYPPATESEVDEREKDILPIIK